MKIRRIAIGVLLGAAVCSILVGAIHLLGEVSDSSRLVGMCYVGAGVAGVLLVSVIGCGGQQRVPAYKKLVLTSARSFNLMVGVGCLGTAAYGLFTGQVATLVWGGAPVEYASRPFVFLTVVVVWFALATYLFWSLWRSIQVSRIGSTV